MGSKMKIIRKRSLEFNDHGSFVTKISIEVSDEEKQKIHLLNLNSIRILTSPNSFCHASLSQNGTAFSRQMDRLRNRWQSATSRTSGFVFLDVLTIIIGLFWRGLRFIFRIFFGTTISLKSLLKNGVVFKASKIEAIYEIEQSVLATLSAIQYAIDNMEVGTETVILQNKLPQLLPGLTFAAAGAAAYQQAGLNGHSLNYHDDIDDEIDEHLGEETSDIEFE